MDELLTAALAARNHAYAPYSQFKVGAAVQGSSGRIYTGCNIENASFGLTVCAEQTAIIKAISEGEHSLKKLAVVADTQQPVSPCGACRQVIVEFGIETIILGNLEGDQIVYRSSELLPYLFKNDVFSRR